jgi:pimeloyl-ACP methyl ester carboxylesterase
MELKRLRAVLPALVAALLATTSIGGALDVPPLPAEGQLRNWSPPPSLERSIRMQAPDGVILEGILVLPDVETRPGPGFPLALLVHSFGRSRDGMLPLADQLAAAGIASLVMDMRGHGSSRSTRQGGGYVFQTAASEVLERAVTDLVLVLNDLTPRPEVDGDRVAAVGVGEGALVAARLAARTPAIAALAMVDPSRQNLVIDLDEELELLGDRPALLVCSGMPASERRARELGAVGSGEREVLCVESFTDEERLLGYAQEATNEVVAWLEGQW